MLRRFASIAFALIFPLFCCVGCTSDQERLAQRGEACDEPLQCAPPLGCACVVHGQPDPEGNEEILQHGLCEPKDFDNTNCPKLDSGTDATATDTGRDTGVGTDADAGDSASDSADATDATDATDAKDATDATDAVEAGDASDGGG